MSILDLELKKKKKYPDKRIKKKKELRTNSRTMGFTNNKPLDGLQYKRKI